ncbi:uncharacterized protein MYCFIDRAFT_177447 [Pseudocercospora fijiensis CIRAD86]|uniref:Uncharacterized protein n=1 Tax=Pseudocercospora fijiensis (strain CIRAD86) TaxID=383855 RepID=M2YRY6_PSEFD|nr:uncharacterized protein MYCFIDRAFT_177447 [Pseudocercospora fijiensis CIRAD86]EME80505.1 hypothetical protein MYCFIDRAFT_177447 [Pseudocercospora fijiensis CIRAD86]
MTKRRSRPPSDELALSHLLEHRISASGPEYLVQWMPSLLDREQVIARSDGTAFVELNGEEFDVKLSVPKGPTQSWIFWRPSWISRVDLLDSPDVDMEVVDMTSFEPVLCDSRTSRSLPDGRFMPDAGCDHPVSFLERLHAPLSTKDDASGRWSQHGPPNGTMGIGMEPRQPLIFTDQFCERKLLVNVANTRSRDAIALQVVGLALKVPCNNCAGGKGTFSRCVIDANRSAFNDAPSELTMQQTWFAMDGNDAKCVQSVAQQLQSRPQVTEVVRADPVHGETSPCLSRKGRAITTSADQPVRRKPEMTVRAARSPAKSREATGSSSSRKTSLKSTKINTDWVASRRRDIRRVRYRCDALRGAFYHSAYDSWVAERVRKQKKLRYQSIEAFLLAGYSKDLERDAAGILAGDSKASHFSLSMLV